MLIGRVGNDASVEKSKNGREFIKFSLATQEYNEKETVWMNIVSFNSDIIKMVSYYKKGTLLCVMGELKVNKFVNKENITVTSLDVLAFNCSFVNSGSKEGSTNQQPTVENKGKVDDSSITPDQMTTSAIPNVKVEVKPDYSSVDTTDDDDLPF